MWRVGAGLTYYLGQKLGMKISQNWRYKRIVSRRKHNVTSTFMAQIESQCEQYCPQPRIALQKVTVVGAGSDVGRIACLFLKQQNVIKTLAMYDHVTQRKVIGVAHDISHIDTTTAVEAYQGQAYLRAALEDADVVLICGGHNAGPPNCKMLDRELFVHNRRYINSVSTCCAHVCPEAIICVQTPPVDCNFSLCKYTMKRYDVYNKRRLLGVNAINAMRANQLYCALADQDPTKSNAAVVGGTGRNTRVPVFSIMDKYVCIAVDQIDCITRLVREADELICRVKSNNEQGHLSIGFSTARLVTQCMKGLFVKPTFIDSALVDQELPDKAYGMKTCASSIRIGAEGIMEYLIPQLNQKEKDLLDECKSDLEDMLNLGRCYALGEDYQLNSDKLYEYPPPEPMAECKMSKPC